VSAPGDTSEPIKVAVLGGGVGAIVAAFELTQPGQEGRFEVTVYQPGWRLGGKGASGRNMDPGRGKRIEEHGLHVWFGFYENAFEVMDAAYRELAAKRVGAGPFKSVWEAFVGCDEIVAFDRQGEQWVQLPGHIDPNPGKPGHGFEPKDFWEIAATVVETQLEKWSHVFLGLLRDNFYKPSFWARLSDAWSDGRATEKQFRGMGDRLGVTHEAIHYASGQHLLRLAHAHATQTHLTMMPAAAARRDPWDLVNLCNAFRDFVYKHFLAERIDDDAELRFFFTTLDAWVSGLYGVVADGVLDHGWDCINDKDLCQWLSDNGANTITVGATPEVRSPMLRAIYDLAFAYIDGDLSQADASAGTAAGTLLRLLFNHAGSILYKMQAGMGDTVFTPFYLALRERGVKFRFFHTVTRLGLSGDNTTVDEIEVVEQVRLAPGLTEYQPLVKAHENDENPWCWPSEPLWDQIRASPHDFPISLSALEQNGNPFKAKPTVLKRRDGADDGDFDQVVLGISIGALVPICKDLIEANDAFKTAIDTARTTPTQGFQLWLGKDTAGLGWTHGTNSVAGAYEEPMDTYCDMTHLAPVEDWPSSAGLHSIGYFCGVLPRIDGETQAQATQRVKVGARDFLSGSIAPLWPGGVTAGGALDKGLLVGSSADRLEDQYYRANIDGTELYVLTPKGTVDSRLKSEDSGFENLVLAGDWTRNGIDGGCVESAALSGRQAARKLTGSERRYVGEEPAALAVAGEKPFVEYGTLETSPGPFSCTGGKFLVLVLKADEAKIRHLIQRVLTDTATTAVRYRPLGNHVALMIGHIDAIRSTSPKFEDRGYAAEWQAALMMPVLTETRHGPVWLPSGIATFMPFLFVDNAISLSGGREIYGLAKAIGKFPYEDPPGDWRHRPFAVRGYGGNFGPREKAGWKSLIAVEPTGSSGAPRDEWDKLEDLVRHLFGQAGHTGDNDFVHGGLTVAFRHIEEAFLGAMPQLVLKQFRASDTPTMASFRQPGAVHLKVNTLSGRRSQKDWQFTLTPLDSHPITGDVGLGNQPASFAFELEMDFVLT
jgi:uncharacterized protein with NAD-binding domain and iron-sulfur cluster